MLRADVVKKSCSLVLEIAEPVETLKKLALFFQDRHIGIDDLTMHRYRSGNAQVIIRCAIEKDRLSRTRDLLEKLPGVIELEWMEAKA